MAREKGGVFWSEMGTGAVIFIIWMIAEHVLFILTATKYRHLAANILLPVWAGTGGAFIFPIDVFLIGFFFYLLFTDPGEVFEKIGYPFSKLFRLFKFLVAFGTAETKYRGVKVMSEDKRNELEDKQDELVKQIAQLQTENPELMDNDAITKELSKTFSDTGLKSTYDGYFAEAGKRFALRQVSKTSQAKKVVLDQMIGLCKQLAEINRALADLSESEYERAIAIEKRRLREERIKTGKVRETVQKEMEIKDLELDYQKAQIETKIQIELSEQEKMRKVPEKDKTKEQKGISPHERFIQSTTDKIEMLKAKNKSLDMAKKARDEELLSIDQQKDPELYNQVKRMWNNFIMELIEK